VFERKSVYVQWVIFRTVSISKFATQLCGPKDGKCRGKCVGGFAEGTDVISIARTSRNGEECCLKTFVSRASWRAVVAELFALTCTS
jgi:hypothetical protein